MSIDLDDYRRTVLEQLADLPAHELRQARETIDDWLAEREGDDLPSPAAYAQELRASLGAGREQAARRERFGRWLRANWLPVTVFGTIAVLATWFLTVDADLATVGGEATSMTMPHRTYRATTFDMSGTTMFHCQPGDLTVEFILVSEPEVLVKAIRLKSLESEGSAWSQVVRRIGADIETAPGSGRYKPVKNAHLGPEGANVRLRYQFDRCLSGVGHVHYVTHVEVVSRRHGRTRTEQLELQDKIGFTGCRLAETDVEC